MNKISHILIIGSLIFITLTGKDILSAKELAKSCNTNGQYTLMQTTVKCEVIEND